MEYLKIKLKIGSESTTMEECLYFRKEQQIKKLRKYKEKI